MVAHPSEEKSHDFEKKSSGNLTENISEEVIS